MEGEESEEHDKGWRCFQKKNRRELSNSKAWPGKIQSCQGMISFCAAGMAKSVTGCDGVEDGDVLFLSCSSPFFSLVYVPPFRSFPLWFLSVLFPFSSNSNSISSSSIPTSYLIARSSILFEFIGPLSGELLQASLLFPLSSSSPVAKGPIKLLSRREKSRPIGSGSGTFH